MPSQFSALAVVLEILITLASRHRPTPRVADLYDLVAWRALWEHALASAADSSGDSVTSGSVPGSALVVTDSSVCPYLGLTAFRQEDASWFFGRDRATATLARLLTDAAETQGAVILVGASGAGKSSLIRAGLLPALAKAALPLDGSANWPVVTMTPGADPLGQLVTHIPELAEPLAAPEHVDPADDAVRMAVAAHTRHRADGAARLVLVVDQFEETFTLCQREDERRSFVQVLHAASTPAVPGGIPPALVVLGLRADFYSRCLDYPQLAETLQERQFVLGPMTITELRAAIEGPAKAVGLQLEAGLVELIMRDLRAGGTQRGRSNRATHDAGALPLLSHALLATWQRRQTGKLTISGYLAAGAIEGAISATAERAWAQLNPDEQTAARHLLLRLVHVGNDTQDTRRRSTRQELLNEAPNEAATEHAMEVLADARLITLDTESVEITHEALLRAWPRLRGWIDQDRAGNLLRQRLEADAQSWATDGQDSSTLYRGARLETTRQWMRTTRSADLSAVARRFLAASVRYQRR
ncbi:MAG TPA: ATP-binding protein, partial [Pseudonocardiaceae bacterium]